MFSKPMIVAGLVSHAQAVAVYGVIVKPTTATDEAVDKSNARSCMTCVIDRSDAKWYFDKTKGNWKSYASKTTTSVASNKVVGEGICCKTLNTQESGGSTKAFCTEALSTSTAAHDAPIGPNYAADVNLQGVVAACPLYDALCVATVKFGTVDLASAQLDATKRLITLKKTGDAAKLTLTALTTSQMTAGKYFKESCTYVVSSLCGAPVISVDSTSTSTGQWAVYVTEYTAVGLKGPAGTGSTALVGTSYYPQAAQVSTFATATTNTPNNELGGIQFKVPHTSGNHLRVMPGRLVLAWLKAVTDEYDLFAKNKALYDAASKKLKAGDISDKPWEPAQPSEMPAMLKTLKFSVTAEKAFGTTMTAPGWGFPSAYTISFGAANLKAGKYFGTLAGNATLASAPVQPVITGATAWGGMRVTSQVGKTATNSDATKKCDPAYVMITGQAIATDSGASKILKLDVTEVVWGKTMEEMVVARPAAVTKNPDGAKWLGVTITAAMAALTLF